VAWAKRTVLQAGHAIARFEDPIELHGNELSAQFERATAFCKSYQISQFKEQDFWADLQTFCSFLIEIYDGHRLGKSPLSDNPETALVQETLEALVRPTKHGKGQGRGLSFAERVAVERRAMEVTADTLRQIGFTSITDTSATESFDYSAQKADKTWKIEVKGTTSAYSDSFLLTAAELNLHIQNRGATILALVRNIDLQRSSEQGPTASGGKVDLMIPWDPTAWDFEPTAYKAKRKASEPTGAAAQSQSVLNENVIGSPI
jgi:hypothetical protein